MQLGFLVVVEFTCNAEFVYGDVVQPFWDNDGIVTEVETQHTDVIHL